MNTYKPTPLLRAQRKLKDKIAFMNINRRELEVVPFKIIHALLSTFVKSKPYPPVCLIPNSILKDVIKQAAVEHIHLLPFHPHLDAHKHARESSSPIVSECSQRFINIVGPAGNAVDGLCNSAALCVGAGRGVWGVGGD